MTEPLRICVLGAGVIGLHVAVRLQRDFPAARVTIIAAGQGHETTSIGAAGIFRPVDFYTAQPQMKREIVDESWRYYRDVLSSDQAAAAGLCEVSGYFLTRHGPEIVSNAQLRRLCPDYRAATERELNICPGGWTDGVFCTTMVTDDTFHLNWLTQKFREAGGDIISCTVKSLSDITGYDIVVNCSGIGARRLTGDRRLVPIRGQVIQVKAPWIKTFFFGDDETYIIPGVNHVTLGGSRTLSSDTTLDEAESSAIWARCVAMVPSLKRAEIIREWAGLRPHRDPVRIEKERLDKGATVIHCYGHGSCGVMFAPGSAGQVSRLVGEVRGGDLSNPTVSKL